MELKIPVIMRQNFWSKHEGVYETILSTNILICPGGHSQNALTQTRGEYNIDPNWRGKHQAKQFVHSINPNDYVLVYDREHAYALVCKITSDIITNKVNDIKIIRSKPCCHEPILTTCPTCASSIKTIISRKYVQDNPKKCLQYIDEKYTVENMHAIYRKIEVVGKISNSEIYDRHKTLPGSLRKLKRNQMLSISDIQTL